MDRRIVFLDIDGTLITDRQELPDSARAALVEARARGHVLFLSSGRSLPEIYPWLIDVGFDGIVGGGGSFARVGEKTLFEHLIAPDELARVTEYFHAHRIDYVLQSSTGIYPSPGFQAHFERLSDSLSEDGQPDDDAGHRPDWSALAEIMRRHVDDPVRSVGKSTFVCPEDGSIHLGQVQGDWAGVYDIVPGSLDVLGVDNGELMIRGVNKGSAAREVAEYLGIPIEASIAFGDSDNDLEMIRDCGVGVAMGNARENIKQVADFVTGAVGADGLAAGFARLGLIG